MKIFIPEGFIYFYVYGGVSDNLFSILYGSIDVSSFMPTYFNNAVAYDFSNFAERKIPWGRVWKNIYFRQESPFFINLAINDRHNWAYPHTLYKLLLDRNHSIHISNCSMIKGYITPQHIPFYTVTLEHGLILENYNDFYCEYIVDHINLHYLRPVMRRIYIREAFCNDHDWSYKYQLIDIIGDFLPISLFKAYNSLYYYFKICIGIVFVYIRADMLSSSIFLCIYFFLFLAFNIYYFRKIELIFRSPNMLLLLNEYDDLFNSIFQVTKRKNYLLYRMLRYNYMEEYVHFNHKYFIKVLNLKRLFFSFEYSYFIFIFVNYLICIINFFSFFYRFPFWFYSAISNNFKRLYFPFRIFISKYTDNYIALTFRHLHFWIFSIITFIFHGIRNTTAKAGINGWLNWRQYSHDWDRFIQDEWTKILDYHSRKEKWEKKEKELKKIKEEELQVEEDNRYRAFLKQRGIDDDQIERMVEYQRKVRKSKPKVVNLTKEATMTYQEYKKMYGLDEKDMFKEERKKGYASEPWIYLYNKFLFDFYHKLIIETGAVRRKPTKEDSDEDVINFKLPEKEIDEEFIKEMSFYSWLLDRKYLLLRSDYGFFDYSDWMKLQKEELQYYSETAYVVRILNLIFNIFNYWHFTDNKYYNYYFFFDRDFYISMFIKIFRLSNWIFFKILAKENIFFNGFIFFSSNLFKFSTFFSLLIYYGILYFWFLWYIVYTFFKLLFSRNRLLLKYYFDIFLNLFQMALKIRHPYFSIAINELYKLFIVLVKFFKYFIKLPIKLLYFIAKQIYNVYSFIVTNFSGVFFRLKRFMFDLWFFFYCNGRIILKTFRHVFIIFLFVFFLTGITPFGVIHAVSVFVIKFIFNLLLSVSDLHFLYSIKASIMFFFGLEFKYQFKLFMLPFWLSYSFYLENVYNIYIYSYIETIFTFICDLLLFPFYIFFNYTPYCSFILSWEWYSNAKIQRLHFLMMYHVTQELTWQAHHFWKSMFGGFIWHPIYALVKNKHGELSSILNYIWFVVFKYKYKLYISLFFFRLPCFILFFPYWVVRYGPYYILSRKFGLGIDSVFVNLSIYYTIFFYYLRWHILGWIVTVLSIYTICPTLIVRYMFDYFLEFEYLRFIYIHMSIYFNLVKLGLTDYYYICTASSHFVDSFKFRFIRFVWFSVETWSKFIICFYLSSISTFKFVMHFFQCFIPFVRHMIRYECFCFLIVFDLFKSLVNIILGLYYLFLYVCNSIWIFSVLVITPLSVYPFIGFIIGCFSEFFYKVVLFPYYVLHVEGFFDYLGKYGFFVRPGVYTYSTTFISYWKIKRTYINVNKRWSLSAFEGYEDLDLAFTLRSMHFQPIGAGSAFFYFYVWVIYMLLLFIFSMIFNSINNLVRTKDNVKSDSMYLWYRLTSENKISKLSGNELIWLTKNRWLFSLYGIKDLFENDFYKKFVDRPKDLSQFTFDRIYYSMLNGYYSSFESKTPDFNRFVNRLLVYASRRYHSKFVKQHEHDDVQDVIRFTLVCTKIESLFNTNVLNRAFAEDVLKKIDFKLSSDVDVEDIFQIIDYKKRWRYWLYFVVPLIMHGKYSYGLFGNVKKSMHLESYYKLLKLILMKKPDNFKDLHDFYFVESEFYDEFNERWGWAKKQDGATLSSIVDSRYSNAMVYSSRDWPNKNIYNKVYMEYLYNFIGKIIYISDFDTKYFSNFFNFRLNNILNSDRIVETQLNAEQIERQVLEDYTDFMEAGWEQERMDDGAFGIYKYLSDRLFDSFLKNDYSTPEGIWMSKYDLSNKLSLRNFYAPIPDSWIGLTIIMPIIVAIYYYWIFVLHSDGSPGRSILYISELYYYIIYVLYYFDNHLFFTIFSLKFLYFPKLFRRKRKYRTFSFARISSVLEKFYPQDELLRLIVKYSLTTVSVFVLIPSYDFIFFYFVFLFFIMAFYKFIVDYEY